MSVDTQEPELANNVAKNQADAMFDAQGKPTHPDLHDLDKRTEGDSDRSKLVQKERSNKGTAETGAEEKGLAANMGTDGVNYTGGEADNKKLSGGTRFLNLVTQKKSIAAVVGGGGLAGVIIAGFFAAQPFQIVHYAQVLNQFHFFGQEDNGDSRSGRLMQYFRKNPNRGNLGLVGNKLANRFEKKFTDIGAEPDFTNPNNGRQMATIQSYKLDPANPKSQSIIRDLKGRGIEVNPDGRINLRGEGSSAIARQAIRSSVKEAGYGKLSGSIRSRILIKRAGVNFAPSTNLVRERGESLADFYKKKRDARSKEVKGDSGAPDIKTSGANDVDEEGNPVENAANKAVSDEVNTSIDGAKADLAAETSRLRGKVSKGIGVASGLVSLACVAKEVNSQAAALQYKNVVLPLIRFSFELKSVASKVMFGQFSSGSEKSLDAENVGEVTRRLSEVVNAVELNDNDEPVETNRKVTRTWTQAESIKAELGETGGIPPDETIKPGNDPKGVPFTAWIEKIPGIDAACSTVGGFIISAVEFAGSAATGGAATAITATIKSALFNGAAQAAGIDPLGKFIELIARKVVGAEVNIDAKGADLGNQGNFGERLAANNMAIGSGGRELSSQEVAELDQEKNIAIKTELRSRSFATRFFDLKEPNSVASLALLRTGDFTTPQSSLAWAKKLPATILTAPVRNTALAMTERTYAASSYDYGFSEYGFSQAELDSEAYEDPYANAEVVELNIDGKGGKWDERYGDCFGVSVKSGALSVEDKNYYEIPGNCKNKDDAELTRYRFYLLDTLTAKSLACYEGEDQAACTELGFGGGASASTATSESDTFSTPCAAGTVDVDAQTPAIGYDEGKPHNIRVCSIPEFKSVDGKLTAQVNSTVSKNFLDLYNAAKAAGQTLVFNGAASTFRTMAQQQELCSSNTESCAAGFTAQPGYSNHQMGKAIDFNLNGNSNDSSYCKNAKAAGTRCEPPQPSAQWVWLRDNAAKYGINQLSFEFWHWGTDEVAS